MRWCSALLLTVLALSACSAEEPIGPAADLLVRLEVAVDGARGAQIDSVLPASAAVSGRPGATGNLVVHWVDAERGTVLAHGRRFVSHLVMAESFTDAGVEGEPLALDTFTDQLLLPWPPSGRGRLTLMLRDVARAYEVEVAEEDALPIRFTETEVVDDVATPLTAASPPPDDGVGGASMALLSTDGQLCGDGEVDDRKFVIVPRIGAQCEYCDDGNTVDGDGCSNDCRFEMTHLGGSTDANATVAVVFVPMGWGDLGAFLSYVQFATEGTLAADWYDENAEKLSFWAMDVEEIDALGGAGCGMDVGARAAEVQDAVMASVYGERPRSPAKPLQMVFVPPSTCRSYAWFGGSVLLGVDERPEVLAHELGHSLGYLNDEYSYAAEGRDCNGPGINVGDGGSAPWACIAGATCPDGTRVHAYPISGDCPSVTLPCVHCMMSTARDDFCPVCFAQLGARVDHLLGDTHAETCNGADDDIDGERDEGCDCTCTPECSGRDCGPDGCFGTCGTCGAGERCNADGVCDTCIDSCRSALGQDICLAEAGAFECSVSGPTGSTSGLHRCTCLEAGGSLWPQDCGPCIAFGCESCAAGQACRGGACVDSCPAAEMVCDGRCVDVSSDLRNCGGCGAACAETQGCMDGSCVDLTCAADETICNGRCVNTATDRANCGWCGRECGPWATCTGGSCNSCEDTGLTTCGGSCVDLMSDASHCGACDDACPSGSTCSGGTCSCTEGRTNCFGECVDTNWNLANCGSCGNACGFEACQSGTCTACRAAETLCTERAAESLYYCANLNTAYYACGACGNWCADGYRCYAGECVPDEGA